MPESSRHCCLSSIILVVWMYRQRRDESVSDTTKKTMDKQSPPKADQPRAEKIFFIVFFLLIAGSVGATYYRYVVAHDYMIQAEADCDPYTETCFTYVCDPEADEECTGDPLEDTSYYKLITRNAKNVPLCDPAEESCEALVCPEGEADCVFTLCDPATAEEGVECSDPVAYTLANPIADEEESGEEGIDEGLGAEESADEAGSASQEEVQDEEKNADTENTDDTSPVNNKTPVDAVIQQ